MGEQDGSKAMTIYIVVCFTLAMAALVGYKYSNDERRALADDYVQLAGMFADISSAFAPNINDYYERVRDGSIEEVDEETRRDTWNILENIAIDLGIREGDQLEVLRRNASGKPVYNMYKEFEATVELSGVTQDDWAVFLSRATRHKELRQYIRVREVVINRANTRFERMELVDGVDQDRALWDVDIYFVWFGPLDEANDT